MLLKKYGLSTATVQDGAVTFRVGTTDAHDVELIRLPLSPIDIKNEEALKLKKEAEDEEKLRIRKEKDEREAEERKQREAEEIATRGQTEADLQKLQKAGIEACIGDRDGYLIFHVETPKGTVDFQLVTDFTSIEFNARFVNALIANPKVREELQRIAQADFEGERLRSERPRGGKNENKDDSMYIETVTLRDFGLYQVHLGKSNKSSLGGHIYTNPIDFGFNRINKDIRVDDLKSYDYRQRLVVGDAIYDDRISEKTRCAIY